MALLGEPEVDVARYYLLARESGSLAWFERHAPRGGVLSLSGSGNAPQTYELTYRFPSTAVLVDPELEYSMQVNPSGLLGLRVDALVTWSPCKSPYSIVPAGARSVVVRVDRGPNASMDRVTTVTVTNRSTIEAFLARVNQLPVAPPGVRPCPLDLGASMTLSFRRGTVGHPYAIVRVDPGGCGEVTLSQFDRSGRRMGTGTDDGGYALARFVATSLSIMYWQGSIIGT
jgi:hypothetical protein